MQTRKLESNPFHVLVLCLGFVTDCTVSLPKSVFVTLFTLATVLLTLGFLFSNMI